MVGCWEFAQKLIAFTKSANKLHKNAEWHGVAATVAASGKPPVLMRLTTVTSP